MVERNDKGNRLSAFVAPLLVLVLLLAACGGQTPANTPETSPSPAPTENSEEQGKNGEQGQNGGDENAMRQVEHAMGTTPIEGTPQRVVTLYQGATDVVVALGIQPVGVVESWVEKPVYEYLRDDLEGVQQLGLENQPNLEEIYKLDPDVIIASQTRHEEIYETLSQIAPTVVGEPLYDWKATMKLVGEALNMEAEAQRLLDDWEARVADFKEKMGDRLPIEVTITNFRADHARIFYKGYAGLILEELGFTRPEGHDADIWGVQLTSKESIPDMNADLIFNFNSGTDTEAIQKTYEEWTSHPLWQNLDAVKNDQVYHVNEVEWNSAGGYITANMMLDQLYEIFELN
ncbi:ABC transporter substrate-binding protein [Paenibacillus senegalensis]|uniref:ABC transporter substrate-binding protein n=1 Tax=Paenibacillus senegalensis TaxID=1465766 RepID=UPI000287CF43|nr:iron-siderophore ABC transporter substrate-binding protein [Paenibacillus senegalensis]